MSDERDKKRAGQNDTNPPEGRPDAARAGETPSGRSGHAADTRASSRGELPSRADETQDASARPDAPRGSASRDKRRKRRRRDVVSRELGRDPLDPAFAQPLLDTAEIDTGEIDIAIALGAANAADADAVARATAAAEARRAREHWSRRLTRRLRRHAAFGLAPALAPALVFVPLGLLLGPSGINLLPPQALQHLDPVISVGVAALGVFVGLALGRRPHWDTRLFAAASMEAIVTVLVVLAAILTLLRAWQMPMTVSTIAIALALGVAASASSATSGGQPGSAHALASRIADLDDVIPILIGALAIALITHDGFWIALGLTALTVMLGLAVGVIGWLLIERAHSDAERGVFVMGSLALAGGASAYLTLSPLLAGLAAGMFWNWSPGRADAIVRKDLQKFQHPLVVLMLLAAGASLQFSLAALWLFAPFVVFRLAGKLAGGWIASRFTPSLAPGDLGAYLITPGLLGIAFALNLHQHLPPADGIAVLTAVVIGTLASEGVALLVTPAEDLA
jgi:hypothetical protein